MRLLWAMAALALFALCGWAQTESPQSPPVTQDSRPPRSDTQSSARTDSNESSSKSTKIDLSPPAGEEGLDLRGGATAAGPDVQEMQPWDPHKADKNVEIGDFYAKRKNYQAAISRYREALYWKSNDAIATFRLAQALEQVGQFTEARKQYQAYLKILPHGDFASDSQRALVRLKGKPDQARK